MATPTQVLLRTLFAVESVVRIDAPDGTNRDWWRYVLSQDATRSTAITGERGGNRLELDAHLAGVVEQLNGRLINRRRKHPYRGEQVRPEK